MIRHASISTILWLLIAPLGLAQQKQEGTTDVNRIELGRLGNGAVVAFIRAGSGDWGIEISGGSTPIITQQKPAQIEVYRSQENVQQLAAGCQSVQKEGDAVVAKAKLAGEGKAAFEVEDRWKISGAMLSLSRKVSVTGAEDNAGFYSAIRLTTAPTVKWEDVKCFIPGLLYNEPHGGRLNYAAKRFTIREDYLSAPLIGVLFKDGTWAAVLDPAPRGDTTQAETTASAGMTIIDERIQFGAVGTQEIANGGIEMGFWLPGTTTELGGGFGMRGGTATSVVRRRYHPVKAGFAQSYQVGFRFGKSETFRDMQREAWRWAWQSLNPKIAPVDVEVMRHALADHLADRVLVVDDRAGIPFVIDAVSGKPGSFRPAIRAMSRSGGQTPGASGTPGAPGGTPGAPGAPGGMSGRRGGNSLEQNQELAAWAKTVGIDMDPTAAELELWPKIMMGFCGKNVEVADQLLIESDRDPSPRGQRMRKLGTMILESLVRIDKMSPAPAGEGFDIRTGLAGAVRGAPAFSLRAVSEDMRTMADIVRRERARGRQHPEWFNWVKAYCDWLVTVQREDGSFPSTFQGGTGQPTSTLGSTTYAAVPVLVKMTEETGDKKYLDSAIKAADYIWTNYGSKCVFCGATGGDTADKESGMLSLEAFLSLYENTKDAKWLDRAQTAGSYAESWIWIWNVPMPMDATYELGWKKGVPTIGVNGIGSNDIGGVDQYLDWAVPAYARLYKYTKDEHYLDVARVLLHGTKAMLALPGRTYDLKGPGWQQEHWRMGPIRGIGAHRTWLPWISVNHLHGITGLEDVDKDLYEKLSKGD
jgi:hypothetical protein